MAYCNNCGGKLETGDIFCPNCGTKANSDFDPTPAKSLDTGYSQPQKPSYTSQPVQNTGQQWSQQSQPVNPNQPYRPNQQQNYPHGYNRTTDGYGQNQGVQGYQPYGYNQGRGIDFVPWWIFVISFFIFPVGLYYYFANRREKPKSTKNLMYVTIVGFVFLWLI